MTNLELNTEQLNLITGGIISGGVIPGGTYDSRGILIPGEEKSPFDLIP